jgi:TPR repeat protein
MRIYDNILLVALLSLGLGLSTAHALDGTKSPADKSPEIPGVSPVSPPGPAMLNDDPADLRGYLRKLESGDTEGAVQALETAWRNGNLVAGWKLGRMYADGDTLMHVGQDRRRAFDYFRAITARGDDVSGASARFVGGAWVALGLYYLNGIPNSDIKPDFVRAHHNFQIAAVNFADADAQYYLARALLDGQGVARDPRAAIRWLHSAASKDQYEAQAKLGSLLVTGMSQAVQRDVAQGLVWLEIARYTAPKGAPGIEELYNAAWKQATEDERNRATSYFEQWKLGRPGRGATTGHP